MLDNLFAHLPVAAKDEERLDTLLEKPSLKIERIISTGQCSAPDFWYDQHTAEWIVLLQGQAILWLEGEAEPRILRVGDFLDIPATRDIASRPPAATGQPCDWLSTTERRVGGAGSCRRRDGSLLFQRAGTGAVRVAAALAGARPIGAAAITARWGGECRQFLLQIAAMAVRTFD